MPRTRTRDFPVPQQFAEQAHAWLSEPGRTPAATRPAASVIIVRDSPRGEPDVFMLRRVPTMEFAPNVMVFPGGRVDQRDADEEVPWAGPSPQEWAEILQATESEARELVVAAAREVFEECGVLLAGPDAGSVVADAGDPELHAARKALVAGQDSFGHLLIRRGLVLRTDLLRSVAHWVTPEFENRRYDTRFFAAVLPEGQTPDDDTTESDLSDWVSPSALLEEAGQNRSVLLPPTLVCVEQVAAARDARGFLDSAPPLVRVLPVLTDTGRGWVLRTELSA